MENTETIEFQNGVKVQYLVDTFAGKTIQEGWFVTYYNGQRWNQNPTSQRTAIENAKLISRREGKAQIRL